jgi:hypothetical protein
VVITSAVADVGPPAPISAAAAGVGEAGAGQTFGSGVTSADFNGDGKADLAIGTPTHNVVAVLYGSDDGIGRKQRLTGKVGSRRYGFTVLGRDLNADHYSDLVVGAPGAGQVLFGSDTGIETTGAMTVRPPNSVSDNFGYTLRTGDINDDEIVDLVEGGPDPTGHLSFCPGTAHGPVSCRAMSPLGDDVGTTALAVADVNGDDQDDIVQSDAAIGDGGPGGVRLWMGGGSETDTPTIITPERVNPDTALRSAEFGAALDAGPVNDDEFADIVVGAPGYHDGDGAILVIPGAASGYTDKEVPLVRRPVGEGHRFGSDVALLLVEGGETLDIVVAAEGAAFDAAVFVRREGAMIPLAGLDRVVQGEATDLALGHTAGP